MSQDSASYDLLVIGAGPAGYVAAIRAAQLGMKTACVEKEVTLGGTCLNVGCIPSKALLESSEHYARALHGLEAHGVMVSEVKLDLERMMSRKATIVKQLCSGIEFLFKKNKVTWLRGSARLRSAGEVEIRNGEERQLVRASKLLIATGSVPQTLAALPIDQETIVDSTGALSFETVPPRLVVVGAGVIGLELGSVWARLGSKVTVLEAMPKILGNVDSEIARHAQRILKKQGLDIRTQAKVESVELRDGVALLAYQDAKSLRQELEAEKVLVAIGRRPYVDGLGVKELGITLDERARIVVDSNYQTSLPNVFAVGDVIAGPMLAHKAEAEGVACVERMAGIAASVNLGAIPYVAYTSPEVAGVGESEDELQARGQPFRKSTAAFVANGRAKAIAATDGVLKLLADPESDRILGCHIVGAHAGDLIAEVVVAMEFGGTVEDLGRTCHAHPSLSEVIKEAAHALHGHGLS
ncbi:MAG: dihydrolipoyl dehydrogenase [Myxococcota bacterium]|jgi:dihydrolipoamide dehydrogenase|nr:dihydrolipoyl dehydrogenase [Myxococcota bacterium]